MRQEHKGQRIVRALRVGGQSYALCLLTVTLSMAPLLAAECGFGHHPTGGDAAHAHQLCALIGNSATTSSSPSLVLIGVIGLVVMVTFRSRIVKTPRDSSNSSRAPPHKRHPFAV